MKQDRARPRQSKPCAVSAMTCNPLNKQAEEAKDVLRIWLLGQGLLTRVQLHQGLAQQGEPKRKGEQAMPGDVLVRCGYLPRAQLNRPLVK